MTLIQQIKHTYSLLLVLTLIFLLCACQDTKKKQSSVVPKDIVDTVLYFENTEADKINLSALKSVADTYFREGKLQDAFLLYRRLEKAAEVQKDIIYQIHATLQKANTRQDRFSNASYISDIKILQNKLNEKEFENLPQLDSIQGRILQTLGGLYYTEKNFKNALKYFQKQAALQRENRGDTSNVVKNNIASSLLELGRVEEAYQILAPLVKNNVPTDDSLSRSGTLYCNYMDAYLKRLDKDVPKEYAADFIRRFHDENIHKIKNANSMDRIHNYYTFKHDYFLLLSKVQTNLTDKISYLDSSIQYLDSLIMLRSSVLLWEDKKLNLLAAKMIILLEYKKDTSGITAFQAHNEQKKKIFAHNQVFFEKTLVQTQTLRAKEKEYLITKHKEEQWWFITLLSILIALIILSITLFIYREWRISLHKRKRIETQLAVHLQEHQAIIKEKQHIQAEKQKLTDFYQNKANQENEELKTAITELELKLKMQEILLERKGQTIKTIQESLETKSIGLSQVLREIKRDTNVSIELAQVLTSIETISPNIFTRLQNIYPFLNTKELHVCALSLIDITNKEMANLLSLSPKGLESLKYRLKKKLELTSEQDLKTFLIEKFK
ncbi:MAG: hypothetical protein JJT94_02405 [Bernardetiaceae bacterium]|nr:hypothetical protein [Bernardetiaceae bacterium]